LEAIYAVEQAETRRIAEAAEAEAERIRLLREGEQARAARLRQDLMAQRGWHGATVDGAERLSTSEATKARDALLRYRQQQAMQAARAAMVKVSGLAAYPVADVAEAMVQAKQRCIARGLPVNAEGFFAACAAEALVILSAPRE
jgi:hypothetical protein